MVVLLYYYLSHFETLASFGTSSHPTLHDVINTIPSGCMPHLIYDQLQSHQLNLSDTKQPVIISIPEKNHTTIHTFEYRLPYRNKLVPYKLDKISSRYCRVLVVRIYLPAPMDIVRSKSFGIFLDAYSNSYFHTNNRYVIARLLGHVYVLLLLNSRHQSMKYSSIVPLYIPLREIIPHLAVLFLPSNEDEKSTVCANKFENSAPFLQNMDCFNLPTLDDLLSVYSMTKMPSDWTVVQFASYKKNKGFFTSTRHIADAILVQHLNSTLEWSDRRNSKECTKLKINQECFRVNVLPDVPDVLKYLDTGTPVTFETGEYAFLTCHYKEDLSFKFYTNPFQIIMWVGIGVSRLLWFLGKASWLSNLINFDFPWCFTYGPLFSNNPAK